MALRLAKDILHYLREQATPTSLRKLRRQGIETATVIDMDTIEDLVTRAVDRVLRHAGVDPSKTARLGQDAREEFLRLLQDRDSLKTNVNDLEMERHSLQANLRQLQELMHSAEEELAEQKTLAVQEEKQEEVKKEEVVREIEIQADVSDLEGELEDVLEKELAQLPEDSREALKTSFSTLSSRIAEATRNYVSRASDQAREEERRAREQKIDLLERRVGKLKGALDQTEDMLERVKTAKTVDSGVASIYTEVQGLNTTDEQYEQKKGLLSEIFRLNVELNDLIGEEKKA